MRKDIIADVTPHEARVALLEDGELAEIQVELRGNERLVGNIYKGRVANVLPGMQAAFVDVGLDKNAFLYVGDILADKSDFDFDNATGIVDKELKDVNIRDVLKKGQEIMVQVLKQPGGTKGARITTHITLPGRTIVLMPTVDHVGVSRKIEDEKERERLKNIMTAYKPEGMGIIVRTAAAGCTPEELERDIHFLVRLWERIQRKSNLLSAPRLIHAEETLMFRTARDMFTAEVDSFVINDRECYEKVLTVAEITQPEIADRIQLYQDRVNIFDAYNIENKIDKIFSRKVWLDNGAYLVIDEAEALTAIDVNTGKYIGEDDLQETILNANLEAAKKIAQQLRLRDIGGIIIIDFIDMEEKKNEDLVVETLREALKNDRTKTNVIGFTGLGLVEMTRKKVRRRVSALLQMPCTDCGASGRVMAPAAIAIRIRREVNRLVLNMEADRYLVEASPETIRYIEDCNDRGIPILQTYPGKNFYISANRKIGKQACRVSVYTEAMRKEEGLRDSRLFF
jgi:ribonuclease G